METGTGVPSYVCITISVHNNESFRASVFFTKTDVELLRTVVPIFAPLSELPLLLLEARFQN